MCDIPYKLYCMYGIILANKNEIEQNIWAPPNLDNTSYLPLIQHSYVLIFNNQCTAHFLSCNIVMDHYFYVQTHKFLIAGSCW